MTRQRRIVLTAAAASVIGLAVTVIAVINLFKEAAAPAGTGGADPPSVTTVRQGPLSPQVSQSGTLGYADPATVYNLASGTITWLPSVGQVIRPGQALYRVENNPVVLFDGPVPAYRNLSAGVGDGPDVKELNQNLVALGFDPGHQITVDDTWQDATTAAVERWQASLDEAQTGTITLGEIVFLPGAQRITKLDATLGTGTAGTPSDSGPASLTEMSPLNVAPEFVGFDPTTPTTTLTTTAPAKPGKRRKPTKSRKPRHHRKPGRPSRHRRPTSGHTAPGGHPRSRTPQHMPGKHAGKRTGGGAKPGGTGSGSSGGNSGGGGGGPSATRVLATTSTVRQVQVQLDASEQASVKVGDTAQITLPDSETTPGTVTSIGAAISSQGGPGSGAGASGATIPVDIALEHPRDAGNLDQVPVQVQITSAGVKHALIVPVTALLALSGDRYAIETVPANGSHHLVPVTLGLIDEAGGVAQVSAPGLSAGLQVIVPST